MTRRQSGISLVEVLVVMVLLLVGIFSVVRLFPPGFLVNRQSEATTLATKLAQGEVDRFQTSAASLMDGIVPVIWNGSAFTIDYGATPDDMTTAPYADPWSYYWSNVNKFRRILGETIRVPVPSATDAGTGSVYVLSAGPFMDINWAGLTRSLFVTGSQMVGRQQQMGQDQNRDPIPPYVSSPFQYVIDYDGSQDAPGPHLGFLGTSFARKFLITYSYYDAANNVQTVVDAKLPDQTDAGFPLDAEGDRVIPAGSGNVWVALPLPAGAQAMVQDTEAVYRRFADLTDTGNPGFPTRAWSGDPFEFYLLSTRIGSGGQVQGNIGALVFNPRGHDYTEYTTTGPQPLAARIDYDVLDWRIIHEDRPMPAGPPYRIALTLKDIKRAGAFETDQSRYLGLINDRQVTSNPEMVVCDIGTGVVVPPANYSIDYRQGVVTFTDAFGDANTSTNFRFYYKSRGDWALQLQKAALRYRPHVATPPGDAADVGFGEFYIGGLGPGNTARPGSPTRLYFPLMDAGNTVTVREVWYQDGSGAVRHITNEAYKINANRSFFETIGNRRLTWLDIKTKHSDAVTWDYSHAGLPVTGVQGVSFKARVIWNNGSTVHDTAAGNVERLRWRNVEVETFLTRSPN